MRKLIRIVSASLLISAIAYWALGGSIWTSAPKPRVNDAQCNQVDWYNAPTGFGAREWRPSWEGSTLSPQYRQWMAMTETDRLVVMTRCGKERPTE